MAKTYLDTALGLPWGTRSGSAVPDVAAVARVLDETHYGLKSVKDRIIEYLAVASLRGGTPPNAILCLVGPPGVGKTSVAMATAKGLERPLQRISLGGIRDEGEVRGHRRTYVGAMPGRIIDALKRAGVDDPVVVLDEIDKMEADWRGDPAAALMEVLDPVQNRTFRDNYLELEYDLSHVFFIATANYEEDIPETLHDRLEIIRLPGYTDREKMEIAQRHLVPKIAEESGLAELGNVFTPAALRTLIREYTRKRGARDGPPDRQGLSALGAHEGGGQKDPASYRSPGPGSLGGSSPLLGGAPGDRAPSGREPGPGLHRGRGRRPSYRVRSHPG